MLNIKLYWIRSLAISEKISMPFSFSSLPTNPILFAIFLTFLTFGKKTAYLEEQAKLLPLESIVVETDAPFLAPNAIVNGKKLRGSVNEPSYVRHTAEYLAQLRYTTLEKISDQLYKNSTELFNL